MDIFGFGSGAAGAPEAPPSAAGFACHHCAMPIGDGMTVYMCSDVAYCSAPCRRRGRRRAASGDMAPAASGPFERPLSSHTLSAWSAPTSDQSSDVQGGEGGAVSAATAMLGWLIGAGLRRFVSLTRGVELLEPPRYSSEDLAVPQRGLSSLGSVASLSPVSAS
mmetsp:Transcript_6213/g.17905  ORF Transcript_6213/g.17905 Transcript_6213/m.17905 type:complete len:164 (+) Transcript_6213:141-632(+)